MAASNRSSTGALRGQNDQGGDIMSSAKRSALMARIRGRDTGPEIMVRQILHAMGYRFRLHARDLPGRPDIVLRSRRTVIFVHGCFWHRHDCGLGYLPKTRREFWEHKFHRNVVRDRRVKGELKTAGWRVIVVWECQLDRPTALAAHLAKSLGSVRSVQQREGAARVIKDRKVREKIRVRAKA